MSGGSTDDAVGGDWRRLQHGERVEVTLTGIFGTDSGGVPHLREVNGTSRISYLAVDAADAATWRRLPEPLPTEPGTRFWGKETDHPAEWYFVQAAAGSSRTGGVYYAASRGITFHAREADRHGLARLPDPEVPA